MPVHVITASKHESTREVGEAIANRLRQHGQEVIATDAEAVDELPAGDPVVLGSPIYMGRWMKASRALAGRLAEEPPGRPLWMFTIGPLGDPPQPENAKPEAEIEAIAERRAREHRVFTGKLDRSVLNRRERLVTRAVKVPDGDFRDWPAIEAWADDIAGELAELEADHGAPRAGIEGEGR
jgi:menaquinone-dependent protoporphyrinogen oxidase